MRQSEIKSSDGVVVSTRLSDATARAIDAEVARIRSADPRAPASRASIIRAAVERSFGGRPNRGAARHRCRQ